MCVYIYIWTDILVHSEKRWRRFTDSSCPCTQVWAVSCCPSPGVSNQNPRAGGFPSWGCAAAVGCAARRSILPVSHWCDGGGQWCWLRYGAPYETKLF